MEATTIAEAPIPAWRVNLATIGALMVRAKERAAAGSGGGDPR